MTFTWPAGERPRAVSERPSAPVAAFGRVVPTRFTSGCAAPQHTRRTARRLHWGRWLCGEQQEPSWRAWPPSGPASRASGSGSPANGLSERRRGVDRAISACTAPPNRPTRQRTMRDGWPRGSASPPATSSRWRRRRPSGCRASLEPRGSQSARFEVGCVSVVWRWRSSSAGFAATCPSEPRGGDTAGVNAGQGATRASVASAAASPLRTQSGIPTPRYAPPASARPGSAAARASIAATRSRWPTAYCGIAPR
jgi:hypothetical protein